MKKLIEKFQSIEKELANEKGDFGLFALFEREDAQNKWDVLISAQWLGENNKKSLKYIINKINSKLTNEELVTLSRIILLKPIDAVVESVNKAFQIEHGNFEIQNCEFDGIQIKQAYIVTSKRVIT